MLAAKLKYNMIACKNPVSSFNRGCGDWARSGSYPLHQNARLPRYYQTTHSHIYFACLVYVSNTDMAIQIPVLEVG